MGFLLELLHFLYLIICCNNKADLLLKICMHDGIPLLPALIVTHHCCFPWCNQDDLLHGTVNSQLHSLRERKQNEKRTKDWDIVVINKGSLWKSLGLSVHKVFFFSRSYWVSEKFKKDGEKTAYRIFLFCLAIFPSAKGKDYQHSSKNYSTSKYIKHFCVYVLGMLLYRTLLSAKVLKWVLT